MYKHYEYVLYSRVSQLIFLGGTSKIIFDIPKKVNKEAVRVQYKYM
jgi:hypothetical protein